MDVHDLARGAARPVAPEPGSLLGRLARPAVVSALARWRVGRLTVHLPDGSTLRAGDAEAEPHATMWVHRDRFFRELALRGDLGAGESYLAGDWHADDLPLFIELVLRNQDAVATESWLTRVANLPNDVLHRLRGNSTAGSRRNIGAHYDLSNDLFALFLDPSMTYSSAVFESADESLEAAQRRKVDRFAEWLGIGPDDHVLELGCGWGACAIHLARAYRCRVTGITISRAQHALATERVRAAGLGAQVDLQLRDYRELDGRFDKIVSVEMLEAVGREHWPVFFEKCNEVLAPGGLIGIQTISMPDHRFEDYARHCDWIQKYIFPGGLLPSVSELCRAMGRRTPLTIRRVDDIAPHYAQTLRRWRRAFLDRLADVRALGFDDRFVRMWDFYLSSCEAAFRTRALGDLQLVLGRAGEVPAWPSSLGPAA